MRGYVLTGLAVYLAIVVINSLFTKYAFTAAMMECAAVITAARGNSLEDMLNNIIKLLQLAALTLLTVANYVMIESGHISPYYVSNLHTAIAYTLLECVAGGLIAMVCMAPILYTERVVGKILNKHARDVESGKRKKQE